MPSSKSRLDLANSYVPVRLGELKCADPLGAGRSGAPEPRFLPHIMLRARDLMQPRFPIMDQHQPIREAGLAMAHAGLDLVPIVDDDGVLAGVVTERALARRFIRETRQTSTLEETSTRIGAVVEVLEGELVTGEDRELAGRVWVQSMDVHSNSGISDGDIVVVGNRAEAQRLALERGAALVVISNGAEPDDEVKALARERGAAIVVSPLDTYVSARMITLAAPCRAFDGEGPADHQHRVPDRRRRRADQGDPLRRGRRRRRAAPTRGPRDPVGPGRARTAAG